MTQHVLLEDQLEVALQSIQTFVPLAAYMCLPVIENQLMDRCKLIITPELLKDSSAAPIIEIAGFRFQLSTNSNLMG